MTPSSETAAIFFAKSPKGERDAEGDKAPPRFPSLSRPSLLKVTSPQKRQAPSRRRRKQVKERNLDGLSGCDSSRYVVLLSKPQVGVLRFTHAKYDDARAVRVSST